MLFLHTFVKLRNVDVSFVIYVCLSVCRSHCNSALVKEILMKFDIRVFFKNMLRKFKFH